MPITPTSTRAFIPGAFKAQDFPQRNCSLGHGTLRLLFQRLSPRLFCLVPSPPGLSKSASLHFRDFHHDGLGCHWAARHRLGQVQCRTTSGASLPVGEPRELPSSHHCCSRTSVYIIAASSTCHFPNILPCCLLLLMQH